MLNSLRQAETACFLRLKVESTLQGARDSAASLAQFLKEQGLNEYEVSEWEVSVMEGLVNGVRYAQVGRELEPLKLSALVTGNEVEVSLIDHSSGFDWPQDGSSLFPVKPGGLDGWRMMPSDDTGTDLWTVARAWQGMASGPNPRLSGMAKKFSGERVPEGFQKLHSLRFSRISATK